MDASTNVQRQKSYSVYALAFLHSIGVVIYVALVALLMQNAENLFGKMDGMIGIVAFLLLFTVSAAIVGSLIFARPLIMVLNGQKKEAVCFAAYTIGFLALEAMIIFIILAVS